MDLTALMQLYWTLSGCIDAFRELESGAHAEPMFTLVDRRFVAPLDRALDACHAAIKAAKAKSGDQTEFAPVNFDPVVQEAINALEKQKEKHKDASHAERLNTHAWSIVEAALISKWPAPCQ